MGTRGALLGEHGGASGKMTKRPEGLHACKGV